MKWVMIVLGYVLLPGYHKGITWISTELLLVGPFDTSFSELWMDSLFELSAFIVLSAKLQPFCLVKREMFYDDDHALYAHLIEFYLGLTQVSFTYIP